jgi:hypothetical protein
MVPIDPKMLPNKKKTDFFSFFLFLLSWMFRDGLQRLCSSGSSIRIQDPSESDNSVIPSP